jgi:transposase
VETAIEKGFAGPGLLAYIVTSKFADYLPLCRLEDIFERQGFAISRATQSVWCGNAADLVEPDDGTGKTVPYTSHRRYYLSDAGAGVDAVDTHVGEANPYNAFDFTLNRGREGSKEFLKDYTEVLRADADGGYNGVVAGNAITRVGCWSHARKFVEAEKTAPEIAREAVDLIGQLFAVEKQAQDVSVAERLALRQTRSAPVPAELGHKSPPWNASAATVLSRPASGELHARPMRGTDGVHQRRRGAHRQPCR